jgi:hypothetical protein
MERDDRLPSWRPGGTRDAPEAFLAAAQEVPVADRVAYCDNDGTRCGVSGRATSLLEQLQNHAAAASA